MTYEQKKKLKDLRCKAWGITEDYYYECWCGDFQLEDMYRAYRRGKNKVHKEAKEIIKDLLDILFINDCAIPSESVARAEQFLGE